MQIFKGKTYHRLSEEEKKQLSSGGFQAADLAHKYLHESLQDTMKALQNMQNIDMSHNKLTQKHMCLLENLPNIKSLTISMNNIGLQGISHLKNLHHLTELNVRSCGLQANCLPIIVNNFPNLQRLDLSFNKLKEADLMVALSNLQKLSWLSLQECQMTDDCIIDGLGTLAQGIIYLNLRNMNLNIGSNNISGQCLGRVVKQKSLRQLYLGFNFIRDSGACLLASHCTELTELQLMYCHLTDIGGIEVATKLTKLQKLNMSSNKLTDKSLEAVLKNLKSLRFLSMNDNQIFNLTMILNETPEQLREVHMDFHKMANTKEVKRIASELFKKGIIMTYAN